METDGRVVDSLDKITDEVALGEWGFQSESVARIPGLRSETWGTLQFLPGQFLACLEWSKAIHHRDKYRTQPSEVLLGRYKDDVVQVAILAGYGDQPIPLRQGVAVLHQRGTAAQLERVGFLAAQVQGLQGADLLQTPFCWLNC